MFESGYLPMLGTISWKSGFCHRSKANITIYRKEMRTSIHCALLETYNLYNTVAFTMISGFSMSFLLWTILSSSWAEFGLFPSPACAFALLMVLCRTCCMADTVFSHATFKLFGCLCVHAKSIAANKSPVPTKTASTLGDSTRILCVILVPSALVFLWLPRAIR